MVAECQKLTPRRRRAAEHVLRDREVDDDDDRVDGREDVRRHERREMPHVPRDHDEREEQEHLLPGGDDVERRATDAEIPELGHRGVVEHQADDEHGDRDPGESAGANRRSPPDSVPG